MDFFWNNVFEYFKDRRLGAVFFRTLAILFGLLIVSCILFQVADGYDLLKYWPFMLVVGVLMLAVFVWRCVRRWKAWQANRYKSSPLSRDELNKARSKLKSGSTVQFKS